MLHDAPGLGPASSEEGVVGRSMLGTGRGVKLIREQLGPKLGDQVGVNESSCVYAEAGRDATMAVGLKLQLSPCDARRGTNRAF